MTEPMTAIEAEKMRDEAGQLTLPAWRGEREVQYVLTRAQIDRLVESIRLLHRERRELYDHLHRLKATP